MLVACKGTVYVLSYVNIVHRQTEGQSPPFEGRRLINYLTNIAWLCYEISNPEP